MTGDRRVPPQRTARESIPAEVKTAKWPRTSRRQVRIDHVLRHRQPTLTVVLEDVHDAWNVSAVLRSCDAVGVAEVHVVYDRDTAPRTAFDRKTSGSAAKWVNITRHDSIDACYRHLRRRGFTIAAATLRDDSRDLYELELTRQVALVFGNEMRGVSEAAAGTADAWFLIPMQGMVESLNISVACAVSLYEALRQRRAAGMYETPSMDGETLVSLTETWLRK